MKANIMNIKTLSLTLLILSAAAGSAAAQNSFDMPTTIAAAAAPGHYGTHTGVVAARSASTLELERALDQLRKTTAPYLDLVLALEDGWIQRYPLGCASSPEGARAYHFVNPSLIDGEVDLLRPEVLMYEPQEDGSMELIGVDYVIPFDRWTGREAPTLLGQPFLRNETLGVWALQVWAWRTNPKGMFAAWNPDVSCTHAW